MPDELTDQLHRLAPEIDPVAHRELFESSRGRSDTNRVMTLAAAVVLVLGGIGALLWLTGRDDTTPADDPPPTQPTVGPGDDTDERSTLTEGDGYETVLVDESQTGFGLAQLVASDDELDALWSEWNPGPARPTVDFSTAVALVTTRPDNACPDTLVRFDRDLDAVPDTWTSVFQDLSEACEDPLLSWIYVVAIDRSALGEAATIVLPAQEIFDVPEHRLEYVAADAPPGSSPTTENPTLEDTGIVVDLPEVGTPTLHNTSVGLVWVVAHGDGTVSVLPATVDVAQSGDEDAGVVTPQERLVYVASGGDAFFSGPLTWDAHGRTVTGGRTNDLTGYVGRIGDDGVRLWATDAARIDGAPEPLPDRVGTSPDRTLAELRRAVGEPIDPMTFFTLSSSGPIWRHLDATLVVEGGVGRICQLPTDVPVGEQTGCDEATTRIDTQITSSEPTITTWFHAPILAFQDPARGFTSFVPLGGLSSRNEAAFDEDPEAIDVTLECGELTPPFLPSGADVGAASELVRGDTRTIAWGDLASDDVVRQYPDVDLELLPLEADSPQLLTNGTETMHVVPVGDPPVGEIQLGLTDATGCVRHYSVGPGVELPAAIDYARRWLDAIAP